MLPSDKLKVAGMTWENLSEWSPEGMTGRMWDAVIPNMGLMALLRNLRNFDAKNISRASVELIKSKLVDQETVRSSRVLPFRFFTAYNNLDSLRWSESLEIAILHSLFNVPVLSGHTLVLVDRSGSMFSSKLSDKSEVTFADVASLFGTVWKVNDPEGVDLYQFGSDYSELEGRYQDHLGVPFSQYRNDGRAWNGVTKKLEFNSSSSILRGMAQYQDMGGTRLYQAVEETYRAGKHDRVVIITDEQATGWGGFGYGRRDYYDELPLVSKGTPVYIWNLAGYQAGVMKTGTYKRHTFGGLNDTSFKQIPILEAGSNAGWPWEN
jgi:hypothetical protein